MTKPKGYLELFLGNNNFRNLFLARLISLLGDWFGLLAILALLRDIGEESASSFGIALVLKSLPSLFASPWAGIFADRYDRRVVMMVSDVIRFFLVLGFFLVLLFPYAWLVYLIIILQSISATFFEPARSALLPSIVEKEDIATANAMGAASWSFMLSIGALIGGICTELFGWKIALGIDACTYLLSLFFLARIVSPKLRRTVQSNVSAIGYAWSYMISRFECWSLVVVKAAWNLVGAITLILTMLGESIYEGVLGVSILYCARGVGTGLGPILARYLSNNEPKKMEALIFWGFLCGALFYVPCMFVSNIWIFVPLIACAHLGGATVWVFSTVRLQQTVPEDILGRIFAFEYAAWTLMFVCSTAMFSVISDVYPISPQTLLSIMGLILLFPSLGWFFRQKKIVKNSSQ